MKICICCSLTFADEVQEVGKMLEKMGHEVLLPNGVMNRLAEKPGFDPVRAKVETDSIHKHVDKIRSADAVLACNYLKNCIPGYIGANCFAELYVARYFDKPIYTLFPLPQDSYIADEMAALDVRVLNGDLSGIGSWWTEPAAPAQSGDDTQANESEAVEATSGESEPTTESVVTVDATGATGVSVTSVTGATDATSAAEMTNDAEGIASVNVAETPVATQPSENIPSAPAFPPTPVVPPMPTVETMAVPTLEQPAPQPLPPVPPMSERPIPEPQMQMAENSVFSIGASQPEITISPITSADTPSNGALFRFGDKLRKFGDFLSGKKAE